MKSFVLRDQSVTSSLKVRPLIDQILKNAGLMAGNRLFTPGLLDRDPSDQALALARKFRDEPQLVSFRGKIRKNPRRNLVLLVWCYENACHRVHDLPHGDTRRAELKQRLAALQEHFDLPQGVDDRHLDTFVSMKVTTRGLALQIVAHMAAMNPLTLQRELRRGRRLIAPDLLAAWRPSGLEFVPS
jgi:hypothetical protein